MLNRKIIRHWKWSYILSESWNRLWRRFCSMVSERHAFCNRNKNANLVSSKLGEAIDSFWQLDSESFLWATRLQRNAVQNTNDTAGKLLTSKHESLHYLDWPNNNNCGVILCSSTRKSRKWRRIVATNITVKNDAQFCCLLKSVVDWLQTGSSVRFSLLADLT
jgi:hypothetical protein